MSGLMSPPRKHNRGLATAGWSATGAGAAVLTGSTPIGIAIVAAVAGALAWRALGRRGSTG